MSLGGGEIIVLLIAVLLLFGPDKLPELARQLGRGVREIRKLSGNLQDQFASFTDDDEKKPAANANTSSTRFADAPIADALVADASPESQNAAIETKGWVDYAETQGFSPEDPQAIAAQTGAVSDSFNHDEYDGAGEPPARTFTANSAETSANITAPANANSFAETSITAAPIVDITKANAVSPDDSRDGLNFAKADEIAPMENRLSADERPAPPRVIPRSAAPTRFQRDIDAPNDTDEPNEFPA